MRLAAAIFDFDGTLARPALDFALMKRRIADLARDILGVETAPGPLPALEWIEQLCAATRPDPARDFRDQAHAMIEGMEREAAARTSLFPFAREVLETLARAGVASAIVTRNTRLAVDTVFPDAQRYVGAILTREDVDDVKPHPSHLLAALACLGAGPQRAVTVGDHPLDIQAARRAGTLAAAVASGETTRQVLASCQPDFLEDDALALVRTLAVRGLCPLDPRRGGSAPPDPHGFAGRTAR